MSNWTLQSGPQTPGPDMAGSSKTCSYPVHSEGGIEAQNNPADPNAKSYESTPIKMDYSCDMGKS